MGNIMLASMPCIKDSSGKPTGFALKRISEDLQRIACLSAGRPDPALSGVTPK